VKFVFSQRFFILLFIGFVLLSAAWFGKAALYITFLFDLVILGLAAADYYISEDAAGINIEREMEHRFSMGAINQVKLRIANRTGRPITLIVKDEYPPEMELLTSREVKLTIPANRNRNWGYDLMPTARGDYSFGDTPLRFLSRMGLIWKQIRVPTASTVKVYPDIQAAKENELYAHRNRALQQGAKKARPRGQGREFESLRDFVVGDEIRHISWAASARRGKLITRQYTIERSQNIVVMVDAGRLMTARIGRLSKLDHAINAALSIAYVASSGGDNVGLLVFNRRVRSFLPPRRGRDQVNRIMESLYNVEPQMIEPSYARAFSFLGVNCHRRSLVIVLTDLVDRDSSAELLAHASNLVPRHLPLIVTIGDTDLSALVRTVPSTSSDVYRQSVAEGILRQREQALSGIRQLGGLALDVPAGRLSLELVNQYLEVKERGLL